MGQGEEKRIFCVRGEKNALFDEVFFILREDGQPPREHDMLREANRILEESMLLSGRKKKRERRGFSLLSFFVGWGVAAVLSLILFLCL